MRTCFVKHEHNKEGSLIPNQSPSIFQCSLTMTDEAIPNASNNDGGARTRRPVPVGTSPVPPLTDYNERTERGRNAVTVLTPSNLLSKLAFFLTFTLRLLLYPARKVANILFPIKEFDINDGRSPEHAANAFVDMFAQEYIQTLATPHENPFVNKSYNQVIQQLASQVPGNSYNWNDGPRPPSLLLLYIHSPLHRNVPTFLKNVLCHTRILTLLKEHKELITCWGGSIHTADGLNAMYSFQVTTFPFLALVRVHPNTTGRNPPKMDLLLRLEGVALQSTSVNSLYSYLNMSLLKYQTILSEQMMQRLQRQEEVRLREEQDREYREALEADRRREQEKENERQKKEDEERYQRESEERKAQERLERLEKARETLVMNGPEPDIDEKGCARIRLMLPSGQRVERRFRGMDTIHVIRAFLLLYFEDNGIGIQNFQLNCNFPKKVLKDGDSTLEQEALCPQAVIMVQDLDA